jgi:hypothetical protein
MELSPTLDAGQRPDMREDWQTEGQTADAIAWSQAINGLRPFYRATKCGSLAAGWNALPAPRGRSIIADLDCKQ